MTPAIAPVPDALMLQAASCQASRLVVGSGFNVDDWEDLRQDLFTDCLRRVPKFDPSRGTWEGFVRGVVRHHSIALSTRRNRRAAHEVLVAEDLGSDDMYRWDISGPSMPAGDNSAAALELSIDVRRVVAALPPDLRLLAVRLTEMTITEIATEDGRARARIYEGISKIRAAFIEAGITPAVSRRPGGAQ
ncbi:MAG TPA: hypothetical protein VN428_01215 [Bryobacteraceae bacterium]|nr:hypothetical protein [Bryobacteraceae bacterium]